MLSRPTYCLSRAHRAQDPLQDEIVFFGLGMPMPLQRGMLLNFAPVVQMRGLAAQQCIGRVWKEQARAILRSGRAEAGLQGMQLTFDAGQRNKRPGGCRWPTATLSGPGEPFLHIIVPSTKNTPTFSPMCAVRDRSTPSGPL